MCYLHNIRVGSAFMRLVVFCVLEKNLVHVSAGILKQFVGAVENDECYLTVTEHTQFIGFLHQSKLSLCKSDLDNQRGKKYIFVRSRNLSHLIKIERFLTSCSARANLSPSKAINQRRKQWSHHPAEKFVS